MDANGEKPGDGSQAWYDEFSPGLIGEHAERLAKAMATAGP